MIITKIEELDKGKVKIYIDNEYHFWLYQKDLRIYQLAESEEIPDLFYRQLYKNTVLRRAKQKALAILKYMDRTEQELVIKLRQADYTDTVISDVVSYVKDFHYINDERYAANYIRYKKDTKSKRQIYAELKQKGIEKEYIEEAFREEYESEDAAIIKAIGKKAKPIDTMTDQERLKLAASLYRKGFQMDLINKYIKK